MSALIGAGIFFAVSFLLISFCAVVTFFFGGPEEWEKFVNHKDVQS